MESSAFSLAAVLTLRASRAALPLSPRLCTSGAFAWSRHPICLATVLLAAALGLLAPSLPGLVGTVWLGLHFDGKIGHEEEALALRYGSEWASYAAETPRWLDADSAGGLLVLAALIEGLAGARRSTVPQ